MTKCSREQLVKRVHRRYLAADKGEKWRILDESVTATGYHRKHAIRLLKHWPFPTQIEDDQIRQSVGRTKDLSRPLKAAEPIVFRDIFPTPQQPLLSGRFK